MKPLYEKEQTSGGFTSPRFAFLVFGLVIAIMVVLGITMAGSGGSERTAPPVPETSRPRTAPALSDTSGYSTTCGAISGEKAADLNALRDFCRLSVAERGVIESAHADGSLLVLKVSQESARALMLMRLDTEQILIDMIAVWKTLADSSRVTIRIEWRDVVIAEAKSTRRGEEVTIKD